MTKRTRLFIGMAVGVLVAGLGTGLVASYYGLPTALAQFGGNGPRELDYLPQDAQLVAFANVRDVMDSELRRKIMELRPDRPSNPTDPGTPDSPPDPQQNFLKQAGVSVETDVDRVVACLVAGQTNGGREFPLVLARGRFDDDLIETLIRQRGGAVEEYRGTRLLTHTEQDHDFGVAFLEPDLVAFGTSAAVRRAVDTKAGTAPSITSNEEVMALVRDIDSGNAWAVGRFDAISSHTSLPQQFTSQLPPINWFAATGHVNGGVEGLIRAEARDELAANDLRQVVQGFLALARLQTGQNAQIRSLMNSLQLGGSGKTVSLTFSLPPDVIDALAALQLQHRRQAPPTAPGPARDSGATPAIPRT
jgi:hypothetical protein